MGWKFQQKLVKDSAGANRSMLEDVAARYADLPSDKDRWFRRDLDPDRKACWSLKFDVVLNKQDELDVNLVIVGPHHIELQEFGTMDKCYLSCYDFSAQACHPAKLGTDGEEKQDHRGQGKIDQANNDQQRLPLQIIQITQAKIDLGISNVAEQQDELDV